MGKRGFLQISPLLIFLICLGLYFGCWEYVLLGILSAVLHELGHYFYLLAVGKAPKRLFVLSCCAVMESKPLSYGEELLCALCGPLVNLFCFLVFFKMQPAFSEFSLGLALYNLLPIFPLDGGRIFRTVLLLWQDELRARKIVMVTNLVVSLSVMFLAVWLCTVLQCSFWPVLAVGLILLKLDADARREWH